MTNLVGFLMITQYCTLFITSTRRRDQRSECIVRRPGSRRISSRVRHITWCWGWYCRSASPRPHYQHCLQYQLELYVYLYFSSNLFLPRFPDFSLLTRCNQNWSPIPVLSFIFVWLLIKLVVILLTMARSILSGSTTRVPEAAGWESYSSSWPLQKDNWWWVHVFETFLAIHNL